MRSNALPDYKTTPPRINLENLVDRRGLFDCVSPKPGATKRLALEAQAGQGKTIFALQFLHKVGGEFLWFQCGREDEDSSCLLQALYHGLCQVLPAFSCPEIEGALTEGVAGLNNPGRIARVLLRSLRDVLSGPFHMVFDDMHLLAGNTEALSFLRELLLQAPASVGFVFLSRHQLELDGVKLFPARSVEYILNTRLAFSLSEAAELLNNTLRVPVAAETIRRLHKATDGWVMGLVMARGVLAAGYNIQEEIPKEYREELACFFHEAYLVGFTPDEREVVLRLSLIDTITPELASVVAPGMPAFELLERLAGINGFVRQRQKGYQYHHLFKKCLADAAYEELGNETCSAVLQQAAQWCAANNRTEEGLGYYIDAGDTVRATELLSSFGLTLIENNRLQMLRNALEKFDKETVQTNGWLSFYSGVVLLAGYPARALETFNRALEIFTRTGDMLGELHVLIHLPMIMLLLEGFDPRAEAHYKRTQFLLSALPDLPPQLQTLAKKALSTWLLFYLGELDESEKIIDTVLYEVQQQDLHNSIIGALVIKVVIALSRARLRDASDIVETAYGLLSSLRLTPLTRLSSLLILINILAMLGDAYNLKRTASLLSGPLRYVFVEQSSIELFRLIWNIDLDLAAGDVSAAETELAHAETLFISQGGAHMLSQFMHYKAFIHALQGDPAGVEQAAGLCFELREKAPLPYFPLLSRTIIGGAYALLDKTEEAEELLLPIIENVWDKDTHLSTAALFHLAALRIRTNHPEALETVKQAVTLLSSSQHEYFHSWLPQVVEPVLAAAVSQGIEAQYCYDLAFRRLGIVILKDGSTLPVLRIRTFGGLELRCGEKVLGEKEVNPAQCQLIALLVASGGSIDADQLQNLLWPDNKDGKRSSLYLRGKRLRDAISDAFGNNLGKVCLVQKNSVLSLRHAQVDAFQFRESLEKGKRYYAAGKHWQASNAFAFAEHLYNAAFIPSLSSLPIVDRYRETLNAEFTNMALSLAALFAHEHAEPEALRVVYKAQKLEPANVHVARCLYDLRIERGETVEANKVVRDYRRQLEVEDYSSEEIENMLELFWETPSSSTAYEC